jgi:hypothetical protein
MRGLSTIYLFQHIFKVGTKKAPIKQTIPIRGRKRMYKINKRYENLGYFWGIYVKVELVICV